MQRSLILFCCLAFFGTLSAQFSFVSFTDPTDCDLDNGTISVVFDGPGAQYSITSNGVTINSSSGLFQGLSGGTYTVLVTDADGNTYYYGTPITISTPEAPIITSVDFTPGCSNGTITIGLGNDVAAEYSIDGGTTWSSTNTFTHLSAGTYYLSVRSLVGACTVMYATPVHIDGDVAPDATASATGTSDCATADGSVSITSNTTAAVSLEYSLDGVNWTTSGTFTGLAMGTYHPALRTPGEGCEQSLPAVQVTAPYQPVIAEVIVQSPSSCVVQDGRIDLVQTNDVAAEYSINGGASWQSSASFAMLDAGTYEVLARSVSIDDCVVNLGIYTLLEAALPQLLSVAHTDVTADALGSISLQSNQADVQYGLIAPSGIITWQTDGHFSELPAGTYGVAVRASSGQCVNVYDAQVTIAPYGPTEIVERTEALAAGSGLDMGLAMQSFEVTVTDISNCAAHDGRIAVAAAQPSAYEYGLRAEGADGTVWQSGQLFTNLAPGNYQVMARDKNTGAPAFSGFYTVEEPKAPVIAAVSSTETSCDAAEGSINIIAAGGHARTYSIDGGYTFQTSHLFTGLAPATYYVVVRNGDGTCEVAYGTPITIGEGLNISPDIEEQRPSSCLATDGELTVDLGNVTSNSLEVSIDGGSTWSSSTHFVGLAVTDYHILVRDTENNCVEEYGWYSLVSADAPMIISLTATDVTTCSGTDGTVQLGVPDDEAVEFSINDGQSWQSSATFAGLSAGSYTAIARLADASCESHPMTFTINEPVAPAITSVITVDPTTSGNDGLITVVATGTGTLQYYLTDDAGGSWDNTTGSFAQLAPGSYQIGVDNSDGGCMVYYATPLVLTAPYVPGPLDDLSQGGYTAAPVLPGDYPELPLQLPGKTGVFQAYAAYPNPVVGRLHLNAPTAFAGALVLLDANGRTLLQQAYSTADDLDLGHLPAGQYVLCWRTADGAVVHREMLIKQ